MVATIHNRVTLVSDPDVGAPVLNPKATWILTLPLIFLACHGTFSFQSGAQTVGGFLPGAVATRDPGFVGYVVIPGIAYGVMLWYMWSFWRRIAAYAAHFKLLTFLAVLTMLSALWSQDPLRSVEYGFFYLMGTLFAYYLVVQFEAAEVMTMVTRTGLILAVLSLILIVVFPQYGIQNDDLRSPGSWRGIFLDRTTAAKEMVFLLSPTLLSWKSRSTTRNLLYFALPILIIFKAHAVTAIMVLALYLVFVAALSFGRSLGPKLTLPLLVIASIIAIAICIFGVEALPDILKSMGRDPTLTGRTLIWHALGGSIAKRPLLGYGFLSFWQGLKGESANLITSSNWSFGYAHNGTLEIILQLGFVGAILFYVTMLQAIRNAWYCFRYSRSNRSDWFMGLLMLTLIYNLDEATVLLPNELLSILYIVACCGLAQAAREIKMSKAGRGTA